MGKNIRIAQDSNEEYHSKSQYISSSLLKTIHAKSVMHHLEADPPTGKALEVGSAFHTMVLEPYLFHKEYLVCPKIDRRTKAGKAQFAQHVATARHEEKTLLMQDDFDMIKAMTHSISLTDYQSLLIDAVGSNKEYSIYIENFRIPDLDFDFRVRVRPDLYTRKTLTLDGKTYDGMCVDLKSCQSASPKEFRRAVYNFSWHVQAVYYQDLLRHVSREHDVPQDFPFLFLAVEKSRPFCVQLYELNDELMQQGREAYQNALRMWHHYLMTNESSTYHQHGKTSLVLTI